MQGGEAVDLGADIDQIATGGGEGLAYPLPLGLVGAAVTSSSGRPAYEDPFFPAFRIAQYQRSAGLRQIALAGVVDAQADDFMPPGDPTQGAGEFKLIAQEVGDQHAQGPPGLGPVQFFQGQGQAGRMGGGIGGQATA